MTSSPLLAARGADPASFHFGDGLGSDARVYAVADTPLVGISTIVRMFYQHQDVTPIWDHLVARAKANALDVPALLDLSLLLQSTGPKGLEMQGAAVKMQPVFRRVHGTGQDLRVAIFMAAGDMTANTPVDFLLEGSNITAFQVYVDAGMARLPDVPPVDVAFMAIGESPANRPLLVAMARLLADWKSVPLHAHVPVLNNAPLRIAALTRDLLHQLLVREPAILSPKMIRQTRQELEQLALGQGALDTDTAGLVFPLVVRPVGTHMGDGMDKIDTPEALGIYLQARTEPQFFVSNFVNCAGSDGLYRKQRIAFVKGKAFVCHHAVSSDWMVHYLSAEMDQHAERRAEEEAFMATFDTAFAVRHAQAFKALVAAFDLDYFVIDSAELPDGRLLVFEADVIMMVHDMDPVDMFPYKRPTVHKVFAAFQSALAEAAHQARLTV